MNGYRNDIYNKRGKLHFIIQAVVSVTLISCIIIGLYSPAAYAKEAAFEMRACWISYLDIEIYLRDLSEEAFVSRLNDMYDNVIGNNMNTVIVHVRAMGDAMYPSDYFPWSTYISSDRSAPSYDPLSLMVELAHEKGLRFEAWINPYRLSHNDTTTNSFKATKYYELFKRYTIEYTNSAEQTCLALDPSKEEARQLILCGVCEVVDNYDVDGIHFDDYFYVPGMADGLSEEAKMENVNQLVYAAYYNIKCLDQDCTFGISPAGNISYTMSQGTDIETWLSNDGYVDYIMPQIYWTDNYNTDEGEYQMFSERCRQWMEYNKADVTFYVGLALYRAGEQSDTDIGWGMYDNNIAAQYCIAYSMGYEGFAMFRYEWLEKEISRAELYNFNLYVESGIVSVGRLKNLL
ncbi:MAG: family 10 glycosylhydrolase [Clostridium sp.]|nr:family 10 glycosylhydrolase [Clostridium sp.]MCM1172646.1 family 10 glycosylhydrolase [Clostridium sp.]MCM1207693.1 family 10 glycosylhydrolase [Ruminococcus sp.]